MVNSRVALVMVLGLLASSSALDISRLLGFGGEKEVAKEVTELEEEEGSERLFKPVLTPSVVHATRTVYLQVTKTLTDHPVCMTTVGHQLPPCLSLHESHHEQHHGGHYGSAVYVSNGQNSGQLVHPHHQVHHGGYLLPGHHPGNHGFISGPEVHDHDHDDLEYRMAESALEDIEDGGFYIAPTAAEGMLMATKTVRQEREEKVKPKKDGKTEETPKLQRNERSVDAFSPLEASIEEMTEEKARPHPRYLVAPVPVTKTLTRTIQVTKVSRVVDHRVTATLVAYNCVPQNNKIATCPAPPTHVNPQFLPPVVPIHHGQAGHESFHPQQSSSHQEPYYADHSQQHIVHQGLGGGFKDSGLADKVDEALNGDDSEVA